jgi:hypothetical protein
MYWMLIPILIFLQLFFSLQYTQTAIIAAGFGLLGLAFHVSKIDLLLSGILLFLGVSWRPQAALLAVVLVGLMILIFQINSKIIKRLAVGSLIFTFAFLGYFLNFNTWSSWLPLEKRDFVAFNSAREAIQGFEPTGMTQERLLKTSKKVGWSKNDFALSQRKSYSSDSEIYNLAAMEYLAENRINQTWIGFARDVSKYMAKEIYNNFIWSSFFNCVSFFYNYFIASQRILSLGFMFIPFSPISRGCGFLL